MVFAGLHALHRKLARILGVTLKATEEPHSLKRLGMREVLSLVYECRPLPSLSGCLPVVVDLAHCDSGMTVVNRYAAGAFPAAQIVGCLQLDALLEGAVRLLLLSFNIDHKDRGRVLAGELAEVDLPLVVVDEGV